MDLNTVKSIYRNTEVYADQQVTLGGWIRTMRVSKNFGFIELNDGTFFKNIQIVLKQTTCPIMPKSPSWVWARLFL